MRNNKAEMNPRNKKEGSQQDLHNQNDQKQSKEHFFKKKGSNEFNEELTKSKNQSKKKDLYEEENLGIDKQPPQEDVKGAHSS